MPRPLHRLINRIRYSAALASALDALRQASDAYEAAKARGDTRRMHEAAERRRLARTEALRVEGRIGGWAR